MEWDGRVMPEAALPASTQQILERRPDLLSTVLTMLFERFPKLSPEEIMVFAGAQGEARGRALGEATVTLRQLNRRCGPLSEATTAEKQGLPLEQLEALADAVLDFSGPADLTAWLADHNG